MAGAMKRERGQCASEEAFGATRQEWLGVTKGLGWEGLAGEGREGEGRNRGPGGSGVREEGADVGRGFPGLWRPRLARGGRSGRKEPWERRLTANGVEGGSRSLFEALPEPQAVFLAVQQRVRGPVHGPARASRPDRRPAGAATVRASGAGVLESGAPGTPLRSAPGFQPAPTRGRKQVSSASGWGKPLRKQGHGTSGVGEVLPGSWRKWRRRCHGNRIPPGF